MSSGKPPTGSSCSELQNLQNIVSCEEAELLEEEKEKDEEEEEEDDDVRQDVGENGMDREADSKSSRSRLQMVSPHGSMTGFSRIWPHILQSKTLWIRSSLNIFLLLIFGYTSSYFFFI